MKIDVINEIVFSTARSGGKGGQNVNKVETMVEGRWNIAETKLFNDEQKRILHEKLANKITADDVLLVKSQTARTQLANKAEVVRKINHLIEQALIRKKSRIATKPTKQSKEKRVEAKKNISKIKHDRRKLKPGDY